MSSILIFYLVTFHPHALGLHAAPSSGHTSAGRSATQTAWAAAESGTQAVATADPDALYARRADLPSARQAAAIWDARLTRNPKDAEAAAKLARALYWLGTHAPGDERRTLLERGIAAGRAAVASEPLKPDGHFWLAANMGALAEGAGLRIGLRYRGEIRDELMIVRKLDPAYQRGSADRALGRWYYKVPALFGGSNRKSEEHLRASLTHGAGNTPSLYYLPETLIALTRPRDARDTLMALLASSGDPDWAPEDQEYKARGQRLLETLR